MVHGNQLKNVELLTGMAERKYKSMESTEHGIGDSTGLLFEMSSTLYADPLPKQSYGSLASSSNKKLPSVKKADRPSENNFDMHENEDNFVSITSNSYVILSAICVILFGTANRISYKVSERTYF